MDLHIFDPTYSTGARISNFTLLATLSQIALSQCAVWLHMYNC